VNIGTGHCSFFLNFGDEIILAKVSVKLFNSEREGFKRNIGYNLRNYSISYLFANLPVLRPVLIKGQIKSKKPDLINFRPFNPGSGIFQFFSYKTKNEFFLPEI